MYLDTINHLAQLAKKKSDVLNRTPQAFLIGSLMAGAYVGLGVILVFSVGGQVHPAYQKLVMGMSFGIALTLVVFAGSELFTGHTMYMVFGCLRRKTNFIDLLKVWTASWIGNLVGAVFLAILFVTGGGSKLLQRGAPLLNQIASFKMNSPSVELIARAALCNWLICLALWMVSRIGSDAAKCIVIFWCLFGFIASGFEHSVANMTLLSIALLIEHPETITITGMVHNLAWVTLGNILGGSVLVGLGYWYGCEKNVPSVQTNHDS